GVLGGEAHVDAVQAWARRLLSQVNDVFALSDGDAAAAHELAVLVDVELDLRVLGRLGHHAQAQRFTFASARGGAHGDHADVGHDPLIEGHDVYRDLGGDGG